MKTYKVGLTRIYVIDVKAENEEKALRYAEYFMGDPHDDSSAKDRKEYKFSIDSEIEMVWNEAHIV